MHTHWTEQKHAVVVMVFSDEQRTKLVQFYFESLNTVRNGYYSYNITKARFEETFDNVVAPCKEALLKLVRKFKRKGQVTNQNKSGSGRPRTARTAANIQRIQNKVQQSPKKSVRRISRELDPGIPRSSVHRILRQDLNFFPYHIQVKQSLSEGDKRERVLFCRTALARLELDPHWFDDIWWTDEAHFFLCGHVNKKNLVFWGQKNNPPQEVAERPLHSEKVTAWCALSKRGVIGPYFFWEQNQTVTVNKERYIRMMRRFFIPKLQRLPVDQEHQWFQQDGATPHTANVTMQFLNETFPGRLLSRKSDFPWPAHSPDLTCPDFFLWGYLKDQVYRPVPRTLQDLKTNIRREIRRLDQQMVSRAVDNTIVRMRECIRRNGAHVEPFL